MADFSTAPAAVTFGGSNAAVDRPLLSWLFGLLVALTLVGYPVAGSLAQILNLESTVASYPFRGLMLVLSLVLVTIGIVTARFKLSLTIVTFLFLYLARLVVDSENGIFPDANRDLLFYIVAVLVPTLAVSVSSVYNERRTTILLCGLGIFASLLILYALRTEVVGETDLTFTRRASFDTLNPITIGYTGLFTAFSGYAMLVWVAPRWKFAIAIPAIVLGMLVMALGGSRGPLVGAVLFLAVYAVVRRYGSLALGLFGAFAYGVYLTVGQDLALVQRLQSQGGGDQSMWERFYVQQSSFQAAIENPIFGLSYLEPSTMAYPHNLLIESGMALGIFGFALMLAILLKLLTVSFTLLRGGQLLIPFMGLCAFANANLSAALFQSSDFWLVAMLCWLAGKRARATERGGGGEIGGGVIATAQGACVR